MYEGMETLLRLDSMFPSTIREDGTEAFRDPAFEF